jgi:hypothetical protein
MKRKLDKGLRSAEAVWHHKISDLLILCCWWRALLLHHQRSETVKEEKE